MNRGPTASYFTPIKGGITVTEKDAYNLRTVFAVGPQIYLNPVEYLPIFI